LMFLPNTRLPFGYHTWNIAEDWRKKAASQ